MDFYIEQNFILRCKNDLPEFIMVDGVNYKLHVNGLLAGGFRISYGEFDGNYFNWNNKPIDLFYDIVDTLPTEDHKDGSLKNVIIYKTNIDDIISDCLNKLNDWHKGSYYELDEIIPKETQFYRELSSILNKYSKDNNCNTPDFLLASYLIGCLNTFNSIINSRDEYNQNKNN